MTKIYYINQLFPHSKFKPGDEEIVEKILTMIQDKEDLDIRNIATMNETSASSISRLAKRAGCRNFKEFLFVLSERISKQDDPAVESLPYVTANKDWDEIDDYFREAFSDRKIYLYGEGFCQFLVNYTYRKLLYKNVYSINLDGVNIDLVSDETPHDLIIFSQSGENKNGLAKIKECHRLGGHVISITASPKSRFTKESDLSFVVDSGVRTLDQENQTLNYFYGNCLNLIEYLINKYTQKADKK
ncbi:transcriptional regulator, RpiR family [Granulicatella balaenopterae]|uniref:Transcriptional regulator, RpiR family n=1 Tax=Granulicatella balaenopterae TaxID=137733 RepID=A0A1H9P8R0_9LACT|nr:SIS domain-containing protein [Granulicatella balaenopterae]SER44582.1 transcriptional regulator, RpiR family [Granulicatella balaenopterae]